MPLWVVGSRQEELIVHGHHIVVVELIRVTSLLLILIFWKFGLNM